VVFAIRQFHNYGNLITDMDRDHRLRRLAFRAWHRGTREADYTFGCFFDRYSASWTDEEIDWFERLLELDDVYILAWAMGTEEVPADFQCSAMDQLQRLDFVEIPGQ